MASQTSSPVSYKSTHSSRSSVLERAREYNRRIEQHNSNTSSFLGAVPNYHHYHHGSSNSHSQYNDRRRSKSLERGLLDPVGYNAAAAAAAAGDTLADNGSVSTSGSHLQQQQQRSYSVGRPSQYNAHNNYNSMVNNTKVTVTTTPNGTNERSPTRSRAMASVTKQQQQESKLYRTATATTAVTSPNTQSSSSLSYNDKDNNNVSHRTDHNNTYRQAPTNTTTSKHSTQKTPLKSNTTTTTTSQPVNYHKSTQPQQVRPIVVEEKKEDVSYSKPKQQQHHQFKKQPITNRNDRSASNDDEEEEDDYDDNNNRNNNNDNDGNGNGGPIVTPELLVDALSGQEDGLLAIAEKLMEQYDAGYDVMGEAIIDAFADVQKLFQHVVEAAHMEGAAFEAARREEEQKQRMHLGGGGGGDSSIIAGGSDAQRLPATPGSPPGGSGPTRHDEFIDQDVKDVLAEAIRQGTSLRTERKDLQCYQLYSSACQDASSLLPVDSDHRGRLQLSIARAESMSPDRACAILRYAMDDVLRSGLRAHHPTPIPDPSNRADVVLNRNMTSSTGNNAIVQQSSDEALASLMEELKDILQAPIYHDTPLQHVASRFWNTLAESQKVQHRNEARLEQNLGKLKGEFLLARAEWEEKLSQSNATAESYKEKYEHLLITAQKEGLTVDRSGVASSTSRNQDGNANDESNNSHYNNIDLSSVYGSVKSAASKAETVASGVSGFAQHARSLVMNSGFNCVAPADNRKKGMDDNDDDDDDDLLIDESHGDTIDSEFDSNPPRIQQQRGRSTQGRSRSRQRTTSGTNTTTSTSHNQRFQEYSRSPHRVDI